MWRNPFRYSFGALYAFKRCEDDDFVQFKFDSNRVYAQVAQYYHKREDSWCIHQIKDKNKIIFGIFDGHIGPEVSKIASFSVPLALHMSLTNIPSWKPIHYSAIFDSVFTNLDHLLIPFEHVNRKKKSNVVEGMIQYAFQGSCACVAVYDIETERLHIANLGDSRLLILTNNHIKVLTQDANAKTEFGRQLVRIDHPQETDSELFHRGYVQGRVQPVRVLGDAHLKMTQEDQKELGREEKDLKKAGPYLTPPYLSPKPIYSCESFQLSKSNLAVMVSDGITAALTNEEIQKILLEEQEKAKRVDRLPSYASGLIQEALRSVKEKKGHLDDMTVIVLYS